MIHSYDTIVLTPSQVLLEISVLVLCSYSFEIPYKKDTVRESSKVKVITLRFHHEGRNQRILLRRTIVDGSRTSAHEGLSFEKETSSGAELSFLHFISRGSDQARIGSIRT